MLEPKTIIINISGLLRADDDDVCRYDALIVWVKIVNTRCPKFQR